MKFSLLHIDVYKNRQARYQFLKKRDFFILKNTLGNFYNQYHPLIQCLFFSFLIT